MHRIKQFVLKRKSKFIRALSVVLLSAVMIATFAQTASAKTYVIHDSGRILVHTTTATDPVDVLGEAGLELGADDTYTTTQDIAGISGISVRRNLSVTIDYFGKTIQAESAGETVRELLKRLNLTRGANDVVSVSLDTEVFDGMELRVYSMVCENQTYTAALEYETVYCNDATLPAGTEVVLTEGVDGEMVCEAAVTYINGLESERTVLSERVTRQPVNEVIAVGSSREAVEEKGDEEITYEIDEDTITLSTGEVLTYTDTIRSLATAYCTKGLTATGTQARVGAIAVDPKVIPYGTRMFIVSEDGEYIYGVATAEDTGSPRFIHGKRIDLHYDTKAECVAFGARYCTVYILG